MKREQRRQAFIMNRRPQGSGGVKSGGGGSSADGTSANPDFSGLPRYMTLKNVTKQQQKDLVKYLADKPMKELRRNQDLMDSQIALANKSNRYSAARKDQIIEDLQTKRRFYDAAVDRRAFTLKASDRNDR